MGCGGSTEACKEKQKLYAVHDPCKAHVRGTNLEPRRGALGPEDDESFPRRYDKNLCTFGKQKPAPSELQREPSDTANDALSDITNGPSPRGLKVSKRPSNLLLVEDVALPNHSPPWLMEPSSSEQRVLAGSAARAEASLDMELAHEAPRPQSLKPLQPGRHTASPELVTDKAALDLQLIADLGQRDQSELTGSERHALEQATLRTESRALKRKLVAEGSWSRLGSPI